MSSANVVTMNDEIKEAYNDLKDSADAALENLKNVATWNTAGATYTGDNMLWATTEYIPVEAITIADSMIATINTFANKISAIRYVPPTPITNFEMQKTYVWISELSDIIGTNISEYIGSMGIPAKEFQDSIFNEAYERNKQTLNDLYEMADAKTGAKGFTYPNSMTTSLKLDAQQKYQFDRNQISRDITKLVTEWARQNYQFAIEKGISFETFHSDFTYKYCTGFMDIYKSLVMTSVEVFKAEIAEYLEPIKALTEASKLPVDVAKINAEIEKENASLSIEEIKTRIQESTSVFATRTQASMTTFSKQIEALTAVARETAAFIQSASRSVIGIQK